MKYAALVLLLLFTSCGYTNRDSELTGQVKAVEHKTPIICPDHDVVYVSLGMMRNGVGSMSTHDQHLWVSKPELAKQMMDYAKTGEPVTIKYNQWRVTFCVPQMEVTAVMPATP